MCTHLHWIWGYAGHNRVTGGHSHEYTSTHCSYHDHFTGQSKSQGQLNIRGAKKYALLTYCVHSEYLLSNNLFYQTPTPERWSVLLLE